MSSDPSDRSTGEVCDEFARVVEPAFVAGSPNKWEVIETAIRGRARPSILIALIAIPERDYSAIGELLRFVDLDHD